LTPVLVLSHCQKTVLGWLQKEAKKRNQGRRDRKRVKKRKYIGKKTKKLTGKPKMRKLERRREGGGGEGGGGDESLKRVKKRKYMKKETEKLTR